MVTGVVNLQDRAHHVRGNQDAAEVERVEVAIDPVNAAQSADFTILNSPACEIWLFQLPKIGKERIKQTSKTRAIMTKSGISKVKASVVGVQEIEIAK